MSEAGFRNWSSASTCTSRKPKETSSHHLGVGSAYSLIVGLTSVKTLDLEVSTLFLKLISLISHFTHGNKVEHICRFVALWGLV